MGTSSSPPPKLARPRQPSPHHDILVALKRELDVASPYGPAVVRSRSRRSWPGPGRIHEITVVLGPIRAKVEHEDAELAALGAFQEVFDAVAASAPPTPRACSEVIVVREALEGLLAPGEAERLLAAALDEVGWDVRGRAGWLEFVRARLAPALTDAHGAEVAAVVCKTVDRILGAVVHRAA